MRFREILSENEFLDEKRRNPEVNQKVGALDALQKYAGQNDVFVSFTADVGKGSHAQTGGRTGWRARNASGAKLGVNPRSSWSDTPLGIYAYPIDYVLEQKGQVPYAAEEPFIWVFRAADMSKILDLDNPTEDDLARAIEACPDIPSTGLETDFGTASRGPYALWRHYRAQAIRTTRKASPAATTREFARLLVKAGYIGVVDHGQGIIHTNEPTQAVFFTRAALHELEMIRNIAPKDYTKLDLYRLKPKVFWRDLVADKVDGATAVAVIESAPSIFYGLSEPEVVAMVARLPTEAQDFLKANRDHVILGSRGALLPVFPNLSDEHVIDYLADNVRIAERLPKHLLSPTIVAYIIQNFASLAPYLPPDLLPPETLEKAFTDYPRGLRYMALGDQSTEAIQLRYLQMGRREAYDVAESLRVTPVALVAAVDKMLKDYGDESAYDAVRHWMQRGKLRTADEATSKKTFILIAQRHPKFGKSLAMSFDWLKPYLPAEA